MKTTLTLLAVAAALVSTSVLGQAPSPAPAKPSLLSRMKAAAHTSPAPAKPAPAAPTAKPGVPAKSTTVAANGQAPRTAKSLACSKDADAKNIHGKARKAFMSHCKKA
jgi:hypothetical protein